MNFINTNKKRVVFIETEFGRYLRKIRKSKGLTLKELGKLSDLSHSYLSQIELGDRGRKPSIQMINKLASALGIDQFELAHKAGFYTKDEIIQRLEIEEYYKGQEELYSYLSSDEDMNIILLKETLFYKGHILTDKDKERIRSYLDFKYKLPGDE